MTEPTQENEIQPSEMIFITEVEEFVPVLVDWHQRQVATVQHFQAVPSGMEVKIEDEEETLVLEGKALEGFRMGISLALSYLGRLPFVPECEDSPVVH